MYKVAVLLLASFLFLAWGFQETPEEKSYYKLVAPQGFDSIISPDSNQYSKLRWELGKKIFFDRLLSVDQSISCADCHKPQFAFADTQAVSFGAHKRLGTRNTPSLINVAYQPYMMREGGVKTIEMQVLVPIQEENEMAHNIVEIAKLMECDSVYQSMSQKAYGRAISPYVISRSLAVFERTLIGGDSPFDRYYFQGDSAALSEEAKKGMELFYSQKTNCSACHTGFNFSNYEFLNNGLYANYEDPGRYRITKDSSDWALFKVPSLRNIASNPPYLHNGGVRSLAEVIERYNNGGTNYYQKSELIKPLGLSDEEKKCLLAFLESLTEPSFSKVNI